MAQYSLRNEPVLQIAINRDTDGHGEILDVLGRVRSQYGSATNAAIQMILASPLYRRAVRQVEREDSKLAALARAAAG